MYCKMSWTLHVVPHGEISSPQFDQSRRSLSVLRQRRYSITRELVKTPAQHRSLFSARLISLDHLLPSLRFGFSKLQDQFEI